MDWRTKEIQSNVDNKFHVTLYFCRHICRYNVGLNVGTNVGLNAKEKKVLSHLIENPEATADDMATAIGVTKRTIERTLKKLQEKGLLVRSGAKKSGSCDLPKKLFIFSSYLLQFDIIYPDLP